MGDQLGRMRDIKRHIVYHILIWDTEGEKRQMRHKQCLKKTDIWIWIDEKKQNLINRPKKAHTRWLKTNSYLAIIHHSEAAEKKKTTTRKP